MKSITLFHGTKILPSKILKEGLIIGGGISKINRIENTLAEFGLTINDVPRWIWEGEYRYEADKPPHLHMSINLITAVGYSSAGCEVAHSIRHSVFLYLLERLGIDNMPADKRGELLGQANDVSTALNGHDSYVYRVQLPTEFIRRKDLESYIKLKNDFKYLSSKFRHVREHLLQHTTMEIRCEQNIPPDMIDKVFFIDFLDNHGKFGKWKAIPIWRKYETTLSRYDW